MLTKKDFIQIQAMLKGSKNSIVSEVTTSVSTAVVPTVVSRIKELIQQNTDELVELINTGFNAQDAGFSKIEKILVNHEKRIGILEENNFKTY